MRAAKVVARRIAHDGSRVVWVVCPHCDRRHWCQAAAGVVECSRLPGRHYEVTA